MNSKFINEVAAKLVALILTKHTTEEQIECLLVDAREVGVPEKKLRSATVNGLMKTGRYGSRRAAYNAVARIIGNAFKKEVAPAPSKARKVPFRSLVSRVRKSILKIAKGDKKLAAQLIAAL